jgi:ABC-type nitrate/sulfonate/bicarbonate transport system substrate-binding protein
MPDLRLKTVTRTQGNNKALKDGIVRPRSCELEFVEVTQLIDAFRRMVRALEFDLSEMAMATYITARAHGKRFTGLPIFLVRAFHHGAIVYNTKSGIRTPKDLEGRKVGVNRGYTVTTGLWARSVLQHQYGVDLDRITWVLSGDEHVAEYRPPANVIAIGGGQQMADLVASGELAAAIGVEVRSPDVQPLIADAGEAGIEALRSRGHYPINHLMVVRDDLLSAHGDLAPDIFEAFAEAKRLYVEHLRGGQIERPTPADALYRRVMEVTGRDPLPYGIAPNRQALEEVVQSSLEQGIITRPVAVEDLFPSNTHGLTG